MLGERFGNTSGGALSSQPSTCSARDYNFQFSENRTIGQIGGVGGLSHFFNEGFSRSGCKSFRQNKLLPIGVRSRIPRGAQCGLGATVLLKGKMLCRAAL